MRVGTGYEFERYRLDIEAAQSRLSLAQRRLATGKRFEHAAEDPDSARRIVDAASLRDWIGRTDSNLRVAKDYLLTAEDAFSETTKALREAYSIAVRGADAGASRAERETLAREIETLQRRIVDVANSRGNGGQYVFAGQDNREKPFRTLDGLLFEGDGEAIRVEVDPNKYMQVNLNGTSQFFVSAYARLQDLRDHLHSNDPESVSRVDMPMVEASIQEALRFQAEVGYRLQDVARLADRHQARTDELTGLISDEGDIDLSDAVTQMQLAETAYQAALRSAAAATRLRLMDYLQ
jgi:flagellar hook-associated protein 3 FlgL